MAKLSAQQEAVQIYLDIWKQMHDVESARSNLEHKRVILEKEISSIDERVSRLKASRPGLLEQVLAGSQPKSALTNQEVESDRLQAERKSKSDLVELIGKQLEQKNHSRADLNGKVARARKQLFAAIEQDLLHQMPTGCLEYLTKLHAVAGVNGRSVLTIIEDLLLQKLHNDWEKKRKRILTEYGIVE